MSEAALRMQLVELGKSLFDRGLTPGSSGNLSVRVADGWLFTPTNSCLGFLDADRLSRLDADGRHIGGDAPAGQGRAHGLLAEPDGGFLAVAARPGRWLLRCDARGQLQTRHSIDAETPLRTLGGHVLASADGQWLYTTETDVETGASVVGVRHARTLEKLAEWPNGSSVGGGAWGA